VRHRSLGFCRLAAALGLIVLLLSGAGPEFEAAGVIAYTRIQGETYVLLADHVDSDRGWGAFGGHREAGETAAETAAREFREETVCVFDHPTAEDLAGASPVRIAGYVSYTVEVPYVPAAVFTHARDRGDCRGAAFRERSDWLWVPLAEIRRSLERGEGTGRFKISRRFLPPDRSNRLWSHSAHVFRAVMEAGDLQ
jgi:8-oxo-dGTP pyrophosphatase MutT (NUDIX family)